MLLLNLGLKIPPLSKFPRVKNMFFCFALLYGLSACLQARETASRDSSLREASLGGAGPGHQGLGGSSTCPSLPFKIIHRENSASTPFKVEVLAEGLGVPWGMAFLNGEELIWTERQGQLKKIHIPTGCVSPVGGAPPVYARGQGGLLDIVLHPDFSSNQWLYLTYSVSVEDGQSTALARGRLANNEITDLKRLFYAKPVVTGTRHFGSRLLFDDKGFLFMTVGDRGRPDMAQDLSTHFGKLLRLDEEGRPAPGNPFADRASALPEIYSTGHRNPQGLFLHPSTKKLYVQEHGPQGGDEINLIKAGANYGWPVITYGVSYVTGFKIGEGTHKKGMEQPIKYFKPSIAPSSLLIYSGKAFPEWRGDFFSAALALRHLNRLHPLGGEKFKEERLLSSLSFRFRHVIEGPEGLIYASVDEGMILRISPLENPQ